MLPYINLLGLAIPVPAITIIIGIWLGLTLAERFAEKQRINPEILYNLAFNSLIAGVVGARLVYVLRFTQAFIDSPRSLISLNLGLFDFWGGVFLAIVAGVAYGQRKELPLWRTLDALTPTLGVLGVALSLANLASGKAYGAISGIPWAIDLWGASRHPAQIYEAVAAGLILWYLWPSRQPKHVPGGIFLQFVALSAMARLFLEAFRGDSLVTLYNLRLAQIAAWLVLAAAFWGLTRIHKPNDYK